MRIHHHISVILLVAIVGALGLAGAVAVLLSRLETTVQHVARNTDRHRTLSMLYEQASNMQQMVDGAQSASGRHVRVVICRSAERWLVELAHLSRASPDFTDASMDAAMRPLHRIVKILPVESAEPQKANGQAFDSLRAALQLYVKAIHDLEQSAFQVVEAQNQSLTARRRIGMVVIGVLVILFLAVVEHMRQWSARRLVHPVETLAQAAIQAMSGEEAIPELEECGTHELNQLSKMLSNYVLTLKKKVQARTAELERRKETLEHEVAVRREAEGQLRFAAMHDPLTGLCNRELLMDRIDRCIARSRRHDGYMYGILFIDLDRFKEINDTLGHSIGDKLLIGAARRLQNCLRRTDTIGRVESNTVARIGGDEFVILLDGIKTASDASLVCQRLEQALAAPFRLEGHDVYATASIGIATSVLEYDTPEGILRDADAAMYHVKATGKGRHEVFNEQMHTEAMAWIKLSGDLRQAIERSEFRTYYQPIISLANGELAGFETLVRWDHPRRGMVCPMDFIPHVEETGLIVKLDKWVLEQACQQLTMWHQESPSEPRLTISVNVSKRQVAERTLVDDIRRIMASTGVDGQCLRFEITESVIMANVDLIADVLNEIKAMGIQIHMDDFGTGYASLSCLHRYPIDVVKLDREFVNTMNGKDGYSGVVQSVINLTHNLNMEVIVEGVETAQQLTELKDLGSDYAQGYYFSKPLDATEASQLISTPRRSWLQASAA